MPHRITGVFQFLQQRKLLQVRSSQSSRGVSVTSPRLRLDDDHFRQLAGLSQKLLQAGVAVVQVNPHRDREAEDHVESRFIKLRQIPPERLAAILRQKVQTLEGHAIRARIALARSLDQDRVEIHAD